jgi:signal transduction histidine kinase
VSQRVSHPSDPTCDYDARRTPMGSGHRNMADRFAALGGQLEIRSVPSQGTTITSQPGHHHHRAPAHPL